MSGDRRWRVRLTATAESDFRNILRWTAQRFGHAQARIYSETLTRAIKAQAQWIRITNGQGHAFLAKQGSHWRPVDSLKPLNVISKAPSARLDFPASADDPASVARYWRAFGDCQFLRGGDDYDRRFVLAVHRVLFDVPKTLPYSHGGVHILEERGSAWHNFGNRAGSYFTRYADFIAATEGRVEAVSVAVNRWHRGGLRLCVGVRKPNRTHHALQLDTDQCERAEDTKSWRIYHDGRMSQVRVAYVMEAVREAQAGRWIDSCNGGKERLCLGVLPDAGSADWSNSRDLLANLIHYAIIRTNLREAYQSKTRLNRRR